jgi:hypothetical protein
MSKVAKDAGGNAQWINGALGEGAADHMIASQVLLLATMVRHNDHHGSLLLTPLFDTTSTVLRLCPYSYHGSRCRKPVSFSPGQQVRRPVLFGPRAIGVSCVEPGYIGGSILDALLKHDEKSSFVITAVVRDRAKATKLEHIGVKAVVGSHSDFALVEPLAYDSDIVITAANVDDMDAACAILAGLKRKHAETGTPPILIHTVRFRFMTSPASARLTSMQSGTGGLGSMVHNKDSEILQPSLGTRRLVSTQTRRSTPTWTSRFSTPFLLLSHTEASIWPCSLPMPKATCGHLSSSPQPCGVA